MICLTHYTSLVALTLARAECALVCRTLQHMIC